VNLQYRRKLGAKDTSPQRRLTGWLEKRRTTLGFDCIPGIDERVRKTPEYRVRNEGNYLIGLKR